MTLLLIFGTVMLYQEEKYRALFEESPYAIYITTRDGMFTDFNPAMVELFGYSPEELRRLKGE